jgi:hypothetical protein
VATVKRVEVDGATRIVTKVIDGVVKVSCTCCEAPPALCCMYPESQLGITYDREDLPTSVTIVVDGGDQPSRSLALTTSGNPVYEGDSARVMTGVEAYLAEYFVDDEWAGFQSYAPSDCLIEDASGGGGQEWPLPATEQTYIADNFADTYVATCTETVGGVTYTTTKTYNREGLCVWRSRNQNDDVDGSLYYRSNADAQDAIDFGKGRILWSLSGAGFRTEGDGPYNSPAGQYGLNGRCVVEEA